MNFLIYLLKHNSKFSEIKKPISPVMGINDVCAACILDDFSHNVLKQEMKMKLITPSNWRNIFDAGANILFVEAFWRGSGGSWRGIAYDYNYLERELLRKIVRWCKSNKIPTVFWAKEDPPHCDEFIDLAIEFDYIFTTDYDSIEKYKEKGKSPQFSNFRSHTP